MRRTLVRLLCLVLALGLASPAAAAPRTDRSAKAPGPAGASRCESLTVLAPSLDEPAFREGGDNSFRAGARRRLGAAGVAIFGSQVDLGVARRSGIDCDEAARVLRGAFTDAGDAWSPGEGGGLLGQPAGWSCRFVGVRMDPSQHVGSDVWNDPESDVLCNADSGAYLTARVVGISPAGGGSTAGRAGGGILEFLVGAPGANYIECRSPAIDGAHLCEPQLAGVGRGLMRALVRLGGYGSKAFKGAKAHRVALG